MAQPFVLYSVVHHERRNKMFENCFDRLRQRSALVHNITNYVTVNDVANIILACGASPIMADEPEEAAEITAICNMTGTELKKGARYELR